jgi:predicted Zn-dependent protease
MERIFTKAGAVVFVVLFVLYVNALPAQDLQKAIRMTHSERFNEASSAFKALITKTPDNGDLFYYFGENCLQKYFSDTASYSFRDLSDSATFIFQKGIQQDPLDPLNYVGLGEVALLKKDNAGARQFYTKAIALLPSKTNKTSQIPAEKQAVVYIQMSEGYIRAGVNDTAQVFTWLRTAEKLDNKNYDLYIVKGDAYIFLLNDGSNSIANYNKAQRLNPESPTAKLKVGQLWMRARNYKDALNYYYDVIKIDSTFAPAYRELGFLLAKAGRNDEAKKYLEIFDRLSTGNMAAKIQLINTLLELEDYKGAIEKINEVMKKDSSNVDLSRALGYSYFETAQYDKSLFYMRKFLLKARPEKIRAQDFIYYGRALAKNKMDSLAAINLIKGYDMDTTKPELLSEAAMLYNHLKKYDNALDVYNRIISLGKANPSDYYNMGKVYYNLQLWGKCDTTLTYYNKLMPDHIAGYQWRARALVNMDPDTKLGLAKPVYEIIAEKASADTVKYSKELIESYGYLAYYYLLQFNATKEQDNGKKALDYSYKILGLDPTNEKGKLLVKQIEPRIRK